MIERNGLTVIISDDVFGEQLEGLAGAGYSEKLRVARELINTLYMHSIPPPVSKKFKPRPDSTSDDRSRKVYCTTTSSIQQKNKMNQSHNNIFSQVLRFASPISAIRQISPSPSLRLDTDFIQFSDAPTNSPAITPTESIKYAFSKAHRIGHAELRAGESPTRRLPNRVAVKWM
jgi:hypothetical protein